MMRNRLLVRGFALLATVTLAPHPCGGPEARRRLRLEHLMESQTSQASIRSARSRRSSGRMRSPARQRSPTKRRPRSKRRKTRGSIGICSTRSKGSRAPATRRRAEGGVLSYNEFWYERGNQLTKDRRTSLIVDPPDGRIPFTDAARRRVAEMRAAVGLRSWRLVCRTGLSPTGASMGFNSGPPMTPGAVQQQPADRAGAGDCRDHQRDGAQRPHHPDRWAPAHHASPVDGRLPRPLGRRHARRRDDQLPARDEPARLHARTRGWSNASRESTTRRSSTNSRSPIRRFVHPAVERDDAADENPRDRSSSTPATRATTRWRTFSLARVRRRKRRKKPPVPLSNRAGSRRRRPAGYCPTGLASGV